MSAFAMRIFQKQAIIATDTLVYQKKAGEYMETTRYTSKVHHFPTFKSVAVIIGFSQLAADFYDFVACRVIGSDIHDLITTTKTAFLKTINLDRYQHTGTEGMEENVLGNIELVGLCPKTNSMVYFTIFVDRDKVEIEERETNLSEAEMTHAMHPRISEENAAIIDGNNERKHEEVLVDYLKQMYIDSLEGNASTETAYLGGEIHITIVAIEPVFCVFSYPAYTFPDLEIFHKNLLRPLLENKETHKSGKVDKFIHRLLDVAIGRSLPSHLEDVESDLIEVEEILTSIERFGAPKNVAIEKLRKDLLILKEDILHGIATKDYRASALTSG